MEKGSNRMNKLVEKILKNEIEVLKSKYLPEDTGHLRTAVSVLEERLKELPEYDAEYYNQYNIVTDRDEKWNRQWAVDTALNFFKMHAEHGKNVDFTKIEPELICSAAEYFYNFTNKE